jgi:methylenetetrahydrofolate dehydrogenase (NADP+)/methenyltetrahydrofolate cyclohydrolase
MIVNGKKIKEEIINQLKKQPKIKKYFAAFSVGGDEASFGFLKLKEKTAKELEVDFRIYGFPNDIKNDELRKKIGIISRHRNCGGAILQLPLPKHLNRHYALNAIPPEKDVDVIGERSLGSFYSGRGAIFPPAVGVLEEILRRESFKLEDKKVAVIGLGFLVGKPISLWLEGKCPEIYLLDKGSDLEILKQADLIISGVGQAGIIKSDMLKKGAAVIDFGYSFNLEGEVRGDFEAPEDDNDLNFFTPTPGGTGPMLVAKIFQNFFDLNKSR